MNFLGIGSGLDLSTMLDGLVRVATEPKVNQLGRREIQIEDSISGLGILKSALSDFQSASDALKDSSFFTKMRPTLTQPASGDLVKVEAGDSAVASSYDIEVVSLASGSKAMSDWRSVKYQSDIMTSDSVSKTGPQNISGNLTFEFGGTTANISITATDSLDAIKDKIDAISGVSAKVTDDGRLEYNLDDSTQMLTVHGSDDSLRALENVAAYQTAAFADTTVDMGLAGNLSFDLGGAKTDIDLAGKSLDTLAADINAIGGVSARVFEGKLEYFSDDGSELKVTASNEAIKGFANSQSYASATFADPAAAMGFSGTLSFGGADVLVSATDTLQDLQAKIDALDGISASIHDGSLVYEADDGSTLSVVTKQPSDPGLDVFTTSDMASITGSIVSAATGMSERATSDIGMDAKGQLTFEADGKSFSLRLDGTETMDQIVTKINSADGNFGVTANMIDGRLVYQSSITGSGNDLSVSTSAGSWDTGAGEVVPTPEELTKLSIFGIGVNGVSISEENQAKDAEILVDGVSINNDTNTFGSAVGGLTITALKESVSGESAALSVGNSGGDVKSKIDAFASAYNKLREKMNELKGTTDEDGNFIAGKLSNDPIMRNVESVLNNLITRQVDGANPELNTLYSIGLEIESDGTLATNSDRLNAALAGDMTDLQKLFAGDGAASTDGLGDQISSQIDNYVSFTGIIKGKEDSFQEQMKDLEAQYEAHARYIESYEKTLKQQFTALDATMAKMNSIMQYIAPQLAALPGVAK